MSDRRDTADRRRGHLLVGLAVLAIVGQLYGLYRTSGPQTLSWFPQADKLAHLLLFAVPVGLVLLTRSVLTAEASRRAAHRFTASVVVLFLLHAVVSELIQHSFYTTRTGDPVDVLADWLGVAVGVASARLLGRPRPRSASGPGQVIAARPRLP
jgi:VanZ family protein